jgi:hypothetical protein
MTIEFSRHARRRIALYRIDPDDITQIVERSRVRGKTSAGKQIIVDQNAAGKYGFPLKITLAVEGSKITVITAYPLKKGLEK